MRRVSLSFALAAMLCHGQSTTLDAAKRAFDKGDYATSIKLFEEANRRRPDCANLFYIGLGKYRLDQVNDALISFRAAVQCNPKLTDAQLVLGEAYAERGNLDEALTAFTEVLNVKPRSGAALRGAAAIYMRKDIKEKAEPLLETLVSVEPKDAEAHADLAAVYAARNERDKAEAEFRLAIRLNPNHAAALTGLGNLYSRAGDDKEGIVFLDRAAMANPNAWAPHYLLGTAWNRLGEFARALPELQKAIKSGGGNEPQVWYHLARTYGGLDRPEDRKQALSTFADLTKKSKADTETQRRAYRLVEEARSAVQAGNLQGAVSMLEQAREAMPGDAMLLFRLAGLQFDLKQYDQAREYAQAAISISPSAWLYHYLLGLIERSSGHWIPARESLETAGRLNTAAPDVQNALGELAAQQGDWPAAIASFERATRLAPAEAAYRRNLEAARTAAAK